MPDPRFYEDLGPLTAAELADAAGARLADEARGDLQIAGVAPLGKADGQQASFFSDRRYLADLGATGAGACFIPEAHAKDLPEGCAALVTPEPQTAYAKAAMRLHRGRRL